MPRSAHPRRRTVRIAVLAVLGLLATLLTGIVGTVGTAAARASGSTGATVGDEQYRPALHYSAAQNWQNDPNGLIYYRGVYHLFYQYNRYGTTGGNASWGHAISSDLVHWSEQPVAIPVDDNEEVWSGSVVYDKTNSSGLGTTPDGPLVAVYTSARKNAGGNQSQALAYSNDGGTTWTKYAGNPVLDIGSNNFRDPKVFWYAPTKSWRMVVALSDQHKVAIYSSPDLEHWTPQSTFGPAGVATAVWECPDLFPMAVDGNKKNVKWVLTVNVAGKAQYFVGDFDGSTFSSPDTTYVPPAGTPIGNGDFERSDYGDWTSTGAAFGSGPAYSADPTNNASGQHWVDSYGSSDSDTGTLTSPTFTIDQDYINFLMAGGNHPYAAGGITAPPAGTTVEDFEGDSLPGWTGTGDLAGIAPSKGYQDGQVGNGRLDTCQGSCDPAEGTVTSPEFTIDHRYLDLVVGGGNHPLDGDHPTAVAVLVDGKVVGTVTGNNSGFMNWQAIDLGDYVGQQARLEVVDEADGSTGWGHIFIDNPVLSDVKATGWSNETGANLIVDGQVVRSATGSASPDLDWANWDVRDLRGRQAQVQLVDQNTGFDWGHTIADDFYQSAAPAQSAARRANWLDWGEDFYAAVTYNDAPSGKRIAVGWMNNWTYANDIPESPFRGAQSLPRELSLVSTGTGYAITQRVVPQVDALGEAPSYSAANETISGEQPLPNAASGDVQRVDLVLRPGTAAESGVTVLGDGATATRIGYDAATRSVYVDRTNSGNTAFNAAFPSVSSAPVTLDRKGNLRLRIYVDRSSVEVIAQNGQRALTDLVFPSASANAMSLFADGGQARVGSLVVTPLAPAMFATPFDTVGTPTITGTPRVGQTLHADPGTWSPAANVTYQWSADGADIPGATSSWVTLRGAQRGARITVTATGSATGHQPVPSVSAPTDRVRG